MDLSLLERASQQRQGDFQEALLKYRDHLIARGLPGVEEDRDMRANLTTLAERWNAAERDLILFRSMPADREGAFQVTGATGAPRKTLVDMDGIGRLITQGDRQAKALEAIAEALAEWKTLPKRPCPSCENGLTPCPGCGRKERLI